MNKKRYLRILVYFAKSDNQPDLSEIELIRKVSQRLQLDEYEIQDIIDSNPQDEPELPKSEVERFILFDDILDLIAADGKLEENEILEARNIASKLGFLPSMVDEIFKNLRRLISDGIAVNKMHQPEKHNPGNSYNYGKYNK